MREYKEIEGPIEGFKILNDNLTCRGYQFEIGKLHILDSEENLVLCKNGFHFCKYPSGVWNYYHTGRIFKIKAYGILDIPEEPGADFKLVCRKIELIEEITPGGISNTGDSNTGYSNTGDSNTGYSNTGHRNTGDSNTGYSNTGHRNTGDRNTGDSNTGYSNTGDSNTGHSNTGDRNTGDRNTGDSNTGYSNTGDSNTGYSNTGDSNTGDRNTGDSNTGYSNTGDRNTGDSNTGYSNTGDSNTGYSNTGHRNTGDRNTGDSNTGDRNTGHGNCSNYNPGFFSLKDPSVTFFDIKTKLSRNELNFSLIYNLSDLLMRNEEFDPTPFLGLPNATVNRIKKLHKAHIEARKGNRSFRDRKEI